MRTKLFTGLMSGLWALGCSTSPNVDASPMASKSAEAQPSGSSVALAPAPLPAPSPTEPAPSPTPQDTAPAAPAAPSEPGSVDWTNQAKPLSDDAELQERAKLLFESIVSGDAATAKPFWFPVDPFVRLKAIDNPGAYWVQLHNSYVRDILGLRAERKSWEGAQFLRFEIGGTPKWVAPGKEANSIGYYRSLHGKLHYQISEKSKVIDVHTVITWQGRWYVTHLGAIHG